MAEWGNTGWNVEQKNSCMFEFPAFLLLTNLGQPLHSPSALTEHVSLNIAGTFPLDPVLNLKALRTSPMQVPKVRGSLFPFRRVPHLPEAKDKGIEQRSGGQL